MRDYNYAMNILHSTSLTVREKVGLLRTDCYSALRGEMKDDVTKLRANVRYFAGNHPVIERLRGGFDRESRVFWFTFEKPDYFEFGGKGAIQDFIAGFEKFGGKAVAISGTPDWWGVFPLPKSASQMAANGHQGRSEDLPSPRDTQEEIEAPRAFVPKVIRRRAG